MGKIQEVLRSAWKYMIFGVKAGTNVWSARRTREADIVSVLVSFLASREVYFLVVCLSFVIVVYKSDDLKVPFLMLPIVIASAVVLILPRRKATRYYFISFIYFKTGEGFGCGNILSRCGSAGLTAGHLETACAEAGALFQAGDVVILSAVEVFDREGDQAVFDISIPTSNGIRPEEYHNI